MAFNKFAFVRSPTSGALRLSKHLRLLEINVTPAITHNNMSIALLFIPSPIRSMPAASISRKKAAWLVPAWNVTLHALPLMDMESKFHWYFF